MANSQPAAAPSARVTMADIDWVVLNLERLPGRLERFVAATADLGLGIETMAATDGQDVDRAELTALDLIDSDDTAHWSNESLGNAFTHWLCWYQAVETQRPVGVFEDRARLRHDFAPRLAHLLEALPSGWDYLQLGFNTDFVLDFQFTPDIRYRGKLTPHRPKEADIATFLAGSDPVGAMRLNHAFGSFAYVITPAGAQRLLDACFPLTSPPFTISALKNILKPATIDGLMNHFLSSMQAYVSFPPLALATSE